MALLKKAGPFLLLFFYAFVVQPHYAEAQILKKLKKKAQEKLERKAEAKLDQMLESTVDTAYARVERLFGIRNRGNGNNEVMGQGEAGGFANLNFAGENLSHDNFSDVVCTYYQNGVSIDAIVNEQYGLVLELINVPVNPAKHSGSYDNQAYSNQQGMLSNFEYYTRPGLPARVGSTLKSGTVTIASMDNKSIFFTFEGEGGNSETQEVIKMSGTIKLDFSLSFQNDGLINNYAYRKAEKNNYAQAAEVADDTPSNNTSMDDMENVPQAQEAMAMMQQMMGSNEVDLPASYQFDYKLQYEVKGTTQGLTQYTSWVSANENVVMVDASDGSDMMIMDDEREALVTLSNREKTAFVMSSKLSKAMAMAQEQSQAGGYADMTPQKTGRSKSILGYKSDEYTIEVPDQEGKITFWISEEVDIKMNSTLPGVTGFMSAGLVGNGVQGLLMEMYSTAGGTTESYELKLKSLDKVNRTVKMSDYKISKGMR